MGTPYDPQYPPILPPGFHDLTLDEVEQQLVTSFPNPTARRELFSRFLILCSIINRWGVQVTLWLNGSFVSEKENPDDIDVALLYDGILDRSMSPANKSELQDLRNNRMLTKLRYGCDFYVLDAEDFHDKAYWRGVFGFDKDDAPKGIIRLTLGAP